MAGGKVSGCIYRFTDGIGKERHAKMDALKIRELMRRSGGVS
jgi:hypothetical protein